MSKKTLKHLPVKSNFSAKKPLGLVGPYTPDTTAGNMHVFLLVDDYRCAMWVYLLKSKSETFSTIIFFGALVETEPKRMIKVFITDRGGEFESNEFKAYFEESGIVRHYTAPYMPYQNGVVDRRNRTIVEMTRSLLKEMKLPSMLWGGNGETCCVLSELTANSSSDMDDSLRGVI